MSQDFQADTYDQYSPDAAPPASQSNGCLKGCLIVAGILVVLLTVAGVFVAMNRDRITISMQSWAADFASEMVKHALADTDLPEAEQAEIMEQVHRVTDAFGRDELSREQVNQIMTEVAASPLSAVVTAWSIEKQYFAQSGLTEEEKSQGRMTLQRWTRGQFDELLSPEDQEEVLQHIGTKDEEGDWEIRDKVTDEELRAFLAAAKEQADAAGVPDNVDDVDPSDEIKRIVDLALNPDEELSSEDTPAQQTAP